MAKVVWGIELGTTSIKAVKLSVTKEGLEISDLEVIELPESTGGEDELEQTREDKLLITLEALKEKKALKADPCWISIPGHQSFNRIISLPLLDPKKFRETVKFEAQQQMPISMDEIIWDYQLVNRNPKVGDEVQVSLFAVRKEIVDAYVTLMQSAGLNLAGIQVAPLAIYNFIKYDQKFPKSGVVIDIGADNTDVVIVDENKIWIRNVPTGGNAITKTLAERFKIPRDEAEKLKVKAAKSKQAQKIFGVMKPALRELLSEINRSLGFYKSQNPNVKLTYMMLMGAGSHLLGLKKFFEQQLQFRVDKLSHLKRLQRGRNADPGTLNDHITTLAVAMGLGTQGLESGDNRINLVPEEIKTAGMARQKYPMVLGAMIVLVLASLLPMFGVGNLKERAEAASKAEKALKSTVSSQQAEFDRVPDTQPVRALLTHYMGAFGGYRLGNVVDDVLIQVFNDPELKAMIAAHNRAFRPFPENQAEFDKAWKYFEDPEMGGADGKISRREWFEGWGGEWSPQGGVYNGSRTAYYGISFDAADKDGDGYLSKEEARAIVPTQIRDEAVFVGVHPIESSFRDITMRNLLETDDRLIKTPTLQATDVAQPFGQPVAADPSAVWRDWFFRDRTCGAQITMAIPVDHDPNWELSGSDSAADFFGVKLRAWIQSKVDSLLGALMKADPSLVCETGVDVLLDKGKARKANALRVRGGAVGRNSKGMPCGLYCRVALAVKINWRHPLVGLVTKVAGNTFDAAFPPAFQAVLQQSSMPLFILSDGNKSWAVTLNDAVAPRTVGNSLVVQFQAQDATDLPAAGPTIRIYTGLAQLPASSRTE
ncbi:MAG: type IV pilus assembly protein PilM [Planctomycetota bacterium]